MSLTLQYNTDYRNMSIVSNAKNGRGWCTVSERATNLRDMIATKKQLIAEGVGAEREASLLIELVGLQAELDGIESTIALQEMKIAEIDEMDLPFDFDGLAELEGINQMVKKMLKEERAKNFVEFNEEYAKVTAEADEKVRGFEERELQLQRQNEELQQENARLELRVGNADQELSEWKADHEEMARNYQGLELRLAEVEQNRKNAAAMLEEANKEIERLESHIDDLRKQLAVGERQAQRIIDVSPTLEKLYEQVKQSAEKRKAVITAEVGLYREVTDEEGKKELIHHSELARLDIVDSFQLPSVQGFDEIELDGAAENVDLPELVQFGSGNPSESDSSEESEAQADPSQADSPKETSGQEVGETFEQWATREINALKSAVYQQAA
jgi:chromosome segregation ATPase